MNVFINNGIHNGIVNYNDFVNNKNINKIHIFELWVIRVLVYVYGEVNILNPFKLKKADSFKKNLIQYGLKESEVDLFISYMREYDQWLNSPVLVPKTDLPNRIQLIMIDMILMKSGVQKPTAEDINFYDSFFDPSDIESDLVKIQNLISSDKSIIPKQWRRKKAHLTGGLILEEVEPELLAASDYKRYGLTLKEVKQLSNLKIKEINDRIAKEDAENEASGQDKFDPKKLILTSGSGFVDTIVLLSIMATEIMIGLIIAFSFLRR